MDELEGVATARALAAGALAIAGAEQQLSEPDRESLLPDAATPLDEEARGEGRLGGAFGEAEPEGFVAVKRDERHPGNIGRALARG